MNSLAILKNEFGEVEIDCYENWNQEYEGLILVVGDNQLKVRSRLAKKTPKKAGYFVAFWEKNEYNVNQPFDAKGSPEVLAIVVKDGSRQGVFVFPKDELVKRRVLSIQQTKGKMAMRIYPSWCGELNKTATEAQKWQLKYFKNYSESPGMIV